MSKSSPWRSPVILIWTALLLLFFIANAVFIYLALDSNPGLVIDNYYERGQDYEKNMLKRRAADPGWNMRIELNEIPVLNQPASVNFYLSDQSGALLIPDSVQLFAYRPANAQGDFDMEMLQLQQGVYRAQAIFPMPGVWDLLVVVTQDATEHSEALRVHVAKAAD